MLNIAKPGVNSFLEGYKARNLASNKITIDFHVEEIIRLIVKLTEIDQEESEKLMESLALLRTNIEIQEPIPYYDNVKKLGEILSSYINSINANLDGKKDLLKKIIYQYLNLAKKLEADEQINNTAQQIADLYKAKFPIG